MSSVAIQGEGGAPTISDEQSISVPSKGTVTVYTATNDCQIVITAPVGTSAVVYGVNRTPTGTDYDFSIVSPQIKPSLFLRNFNTVTSGSSIIWEVLELFKGDYLKVYNGASVQATVKFYVKQ